MKINNEKGIALVFTLFSVVILLALQGIFVLNVIHEARMSSIERQQAKTFYAAQGGTQAAIEQLNVLMNTYLQNTIINSNPSGVISYAQSKVTAGDGIGWLVFSTRNNNVAVLTQNGEEANYSANGSLGGINYSYNIIFSQKSAPLTIGANAWDFPYSYRIETTGTSGSISNKVVLSGDFTVRVQHDNFAKFALFSNTQKMPNGTNVWFTDKTNFSGPVFTNDRFNFAFNPSGTFQEAISQYQPTARFYNNGSSVLLNANANGTIDVPNFQNGFTRNAAKITNTTTTEQSMISEVKGNNNYTIDGIYLPTQGSTLSGGIYVLDQANKGTSVTMSVNQNKAVYTVNLGSTTKTITVDPVLNQTTVQIGNNTPTTYAGKPNGTDGAGTIIYVNGKISNFSGTVQQNTELTVASHSDIIISNNVRYTNYTPASGTPGQAGYVPPSGFDANGAPYTNLLGLVSWNGNVRVGTSTPNNVEIHGTVMASNGIFTVDNYNTRSPQGTATLLGGAISNNYGAFGTFNGSTGAMLSGYGRNFVYDSRMQQGHAPPYFPSLNTFIAFTNDITDKIVWQEGE